MTQQLPFLKKKYMAYEEYANATMGTLFTEDLMKGSSLLTSEMMQTIYLENNGELGFKKHNLPIEAQYSPVYGIVSLDADHDGHKDLLNLKGDVRNVQLIKNDTKESILIGINDSRALQVFLNETKNND